MPLADGWALYDNSGEASIIIAEGNEQNKEIYNSIMWNQFNETFNEK